MIVVAGIAAGMALLVNLGILFYWGGKLEQKMNDNQTANDKTLNRHETMHTEHYRQGREHDQADQVHFKDNDLHWAPQERTWLEIRFREMGARFDTLERIIRKEQG